MPTVYIPKTGTSYNMRVRKRIDRGAFEEKVAEFIGRIQAVDKKFKPKASLLKKSPDKFDAEYYRYSKELKKECDKIINWIGPEKKRAITSARSIITTIRNEIVKLPLSNEYFLYKISLLKEDHPRQRKTFEALEKAKFQDVPKLITFIKKDMENPLPFTVRKKVLNLPYQHQALKHIKLSRLQYLKFKTTQKTTSVKKHKKPLHVKAHEMRLIAEKYIDNQDTCSWHQLVCAVCLLSGRRANEVIKNGEFSKSQIQKHLRFYGQSKIRNREDIPRDIPIIGSTPQKVLSAIKTIRAERSFEGKTNDFLNNTTSGPLNTCLRKYFNNRDIDVHSLRTIYAAFAKKYFYEEFGRETSEPMYIGKVLGHSPEQVTSQISYQSFDIDWAENAQVFDVEAKEKEAKQAQLNKLIDIIEASRDSIMKLPRLCNAYEVLTEWLLKELRSGSFVSKTAMERDPETGESRRSRKTVEAFIKALRMPKGWPSKLEVTLNA